MATDTTTIPSNPGFKSLETNGSNYIMWTLNMSQYLASKNLDETIIPPMPNPQFEEHTKKQAEDPTHIIPVTARNFTSKQLKTANLYIRLRLKEELALQMYQFEQPYELWAEIKRRFEIMKEILFPEVWTEWSNLRYMDFDKIEEFKTVLFTLVAKLQYCEKPVTEDQIIYKILSTMGPQRMMLRESLMVIKYKESRDLLLYLTENEKYNNLAKDINNQRPAGTKPIPELNYVKDPKHKAEQSQPTGRRKTPWKQRHKGARKTITSNPKESASHNKRFRDQVPSRCFRCGKKRHFAKDCRTPDNVVAKYRKTNNLSPWRGGRKPNQAATKKPTKAIDDDEYNYLDELEADDSILGMINQDIKDSNSTMILDSGATSTVLKHRKYFTKFQSVIYNIATMSGIDLIVNGSGPATFVLPGGTRIYSERALFIPTARRQVLCEDDVFHSGYEIHTHIFNEDRKYKVFKDHDGNVVEKFYYSRTGLIDFEIKSDEFIAILYPTSQDACLWHDRLGHPSFKMLQKTLRSAAEEIIIRNKIPESCIACSRGKLITKPARELKDKDTYQFLTRVQVDICGPISPASGPFRYFMVMIDATSRWTEVNVLSTRNHAFAKMLIQLISIQVKFPDHHVQNLRVDGAGEFTSKTFTEYCAAVGINLEVSLPEVHFQNGLAENLIKRLQWIARPLLLKSNLPLTAWAHAIMHAADLIRLRPSAGNNISPYQLATGNKPRISHLRKFGCAVEVPLDPTKRQKMGPQRKQGIYVGNIGNSLIKYLEPTTGDLFRARFQDCHFDEQSFPKLAVEQSIPRTILDIDWNTRQHDDYPDLRSDSEVRRILRLRELARKLPDSFANTSEISTTPYFQLQHMPARIAPDPTPANISVVRRKRGRPLGSKNKQTSTKQPAQEQPTEGAQATPSSAENANSIAFTGHIWNRRHLPPEHSLMLDTVLHIQTQNDIPKTVTQARQSKEWPAWEKAMQTELGSMKERMVFGKPQDKTPEMKPIRSKWVYARKLNSNGETIRYKARLVAKGYTQKYGTDYDFTYSPVMDVVTFRLLIVVAVRESLTFRLLDVVTAYLYSKIDKDLYMEIPEGLLDEGVSPAQPAVARTGTGLAANINVSTAHQRVSFAPISRPVNGKSLLQNKRKRLTDKVVKIHKAIYGLKQSGRLWYDHLTKYLTDSGFQVSKFAPCVFVDRKKNHLVMLAIYVDDINIFGTREAVALTVTLLKTEFQVKDYGRTPGCLGIELEHLSNGSVHMHMTTYTERLLKKFAMDASHPLPTPLIVRTLQPDRDEYGPRREDEEILPVEFPYVKAVMSVSWLALNVRPDIKFATHLLSRHSKEPTMRHWRGVKHLLRYLNGTKDFGILFEKNDTVLEGFADAGYLSAPDRGRSQSGYVFMLGGSPISWSSKLQPTVATSSNHAELIALYDTTKEAIWLRNLLKDICQLAALPIADKPIKIFEDNDAARHQMSAGYIKTENTKHLSPKIFYSAEQVKQGNTTIEKITSAANLADIFTKTLPPSVHWKHLRTMKLRSLSQIRQQSPGTAK